MLDQIRLLILFNILQRIKRKREIDLYDDEFQDQIYEYLWRFLLSKWHLHDNIINRRKFVLKFLSYFLTVFNE